MEFLEIFNYEATPWVCFWSILGLGFYWAIGLKAETSALSSKLSGVERDLAGLSADPLINYSNQLPDGHYLKRSWNLFAQGFIASGQSERRRVLSTQRPRACFNESTLIAPNINVRFYQSIPNLLVGIGLLCTFLGLVAELYFASEGLNASAQVAQEKFKDLLHAATFKFLTSVAGLLSSILFSVWEKRCFRDVQFSVDKLCNTLESKLEFTSQEQLTFNNFLGIQRLAGQFDSFNQASDALRQSAESFEGLVSNLGEATEAMKISSRNFDASIIADKVTQGIQSVFTQQLTPVFEEIRDELKQLREIKQDNGQEILKKLIGQLRTEVLEPMSERIDQSTRTTERAANAVDHLHQELGGIAKELSGAVVTIQKFQSETMEQLKQFTGDMRSILTQFQDDTRSVLERMGQEIHSALDKSIQGMVQQREAFDASAAQAADTFRGIRTELQEALRERAQIEKQVLYETRAGILQIMAEAQQSFDAQAQTLKTVGAEASQLMDGAKERLSDTLNNIDYVLIKSTEMVKEQLERFRTEYQSNLRTFFDEQNRLLDETLGKQREGLQAVVTHLDEVFQAEYQRRIELAEGVQKQFEQLQDSAAVVRELVESTGVLKAASWDQLQDATRSIGHQLGTLEKQYAGANEKFVTMIDQVPKALAEYLDLSKESQIVFCSELDKAAAKVHNQLAAAAEYLVAGEQDRRLHQDN